MHGRSAQGGRRERFLVKRSGEETMVYDWEKDEVHVLNRTAALVYEGLLEGKSEDRILEALFAAFPQVGPDRLGADLRACTTSLLKKGLIGGQSRS